MQKYYNYFENQVFGCSFLKKETQKTSFI